MIRKKVNSKNPLSAIDSFLVGRKVKVILETDSTLDFVEINGILQSKNGKYLVTTSDRTGHIIFYNDMIKNISKYTIRVKA